MKFCFAFNEREKRNWRKRLKKVLLKKKKKNCFLLHPVYQRDVTLRFEEETRVNSNSQTARGGRLCLEWIQIYAYTYVCMCMCTTRTRVTSRVVLAQWCHAVVTDRDAVIWLTDRCYNRESRFWPKRWRIRETLWRFD